MMGTYRKKTGVGKAGNPMAGQGGSGGNMGGTTGDTKAPQPSRQSAPIVNMKAPAGGGQPSPQDLQKIFDIARQQGPQAVQQYVAQVHGPQAAQALAAHPAVQQAQAAVPTAQMGQAGGGPGSPSDDHGMGPSAGSWGGGSGIATNPASPATAGLAPRYQAMIAAGQDPAAVAARAAQFQAGQLPGQAPQVGGGRLTLPGPIGSVPNIPNAPSYGTPPGAPAGGLGAVPGPPPATQNAGTALPGIMGAGAGSMPTAPGAGAVTKPYQDPNDMRNMLAQRLRAGAGAGNNLGFNQGGGNYLA